MIVIRNGPTLSRIAKTRHIAVLSRIVCEELFTTDRIYSDPTPISIPTERCLSSFELLQALVYVGSGSSVICTWSWSGNCSSFQRGFHGMNRVWPFNQPACEARICTILVHVRVIIHVAPPGALPDPGHAAITMRSARLRRRIASRAGQRAAAGAVGMAAHDCGISVHHGRSPLSQ